MLADYGQYGQARVQLATWTAWAFRKCICSHPDRNQEAPARSGAFFVSCRVALSALQNRVGRIAAVVPEIPPEHKAMVEELVLTAGAAAATGGTATT